MTQVSKRFLHPNVSGKVMDIFLKTISKLRAREDVLDFLNDFLTPTEKVMLSKRLSIAYMLDVGYRQKSVSDVLKVSNATVCNVAGRLKYGRGYRKALEVVKRDEEIGKFMIDLGESIASLGSFGTKGSGVWRSVRNDLQKRRKENPF